MSKIFCIGFSKTGTTSLEKALEILGYKVCKGSWKSNHSNFLVALYVNGDWEEVFHIVPYFDAFADAPWGGTELYKKLYTKYPDARFILTIRDPEAWYQSFENMFTRFDNDLDTAFESIYANGRWGTPYFFKNLLGIETLAGNKQNVIRQYNTFNRNAQRFLEENNATHTVMNIPDGDGWEKLCSLLGDKVPENELFPHSNKHTSSLQKERNPRKWSLISLRFHLRRLLKRR